MKTKIITFCLLLTGLLLLWMQVPAFASPSPQTQYATPTALPDGRIIYIVQSGDTCTRISLLTGVSVDYLRATNQLNENCDLREGQPLLIGVGGPAAVSPTPGPSPTPTPPQPTATPGAGGTAEVCILMYVDLNGDGLRQETEFGVDNGAVNVVSANGQYSQTSNTTSALDPLTEDARRTCFADLQPGTYTVSAGIPAGYNATTGLNTVVDVSAGDTTYVDFGVQPQAALENTGRNGPSPLLGIVGVAFLLAGVGLGFYFWRMMRRK